MGLAPYGEPRFASTILDNLITVAAEGGQQPCLLVVRVALRPACVRDPFGQPGGQRLDLLLDFSLAGLQCLLKALAQGRPAVERLWEVCGLPDYRKIAPQQHADLATTLYLRLMRHGRLDIDWYRAQLVIAGCHLHEPLPNLNLCKHLLPHPPQNW